MTLCILFGANIKKTTTPQLSPVNSTMYTLSFTLSHPVSSALKSFKKKTYAIQYDCTANRSIPLGAALWPCG